MSDTTRLSHEQIWTYKQENKNLDKSKDDVEFFICKYGCPEVFVRNL